MGRSRVLCIMHLPPPIHGVTVVNDRIARSAAIAERFDLHVIPLQFADSIGDVGAPRIGKVLRALLTALRLLWRLANELPDAAYLTLSPPGGAFYRDCLYVAILKLFSVTRIYHLHAQGFAEAPDTGWRGGLYRWAFKGAWVIHLAPAVRADTRALVSETQVRYVANGVPDEAGERAPAPDGVPRILFLSNMMPAKGTHVLLRALGELAQRGVAFQATFAGAALHDVGFAGEIRAVGLTEHVRFLGPVHGADKIALYQRHDIFAFPTLRDAFPLVILEAMQHGLAVVSSREGAIGDIVIEGETGFLVDKGDVVALADRLQALCNDDALRARMGQQGRARYLAHYTQERFEQRLILTLDDFLDHPSPPR